MNLRQELTAKTTHNNVAYNSSVVNVEKISFNSGKVAFCAFQLASVKGFSHPHLHLQSETVSSYGFSGFLTLLLALPSGRRPLHRCPAVAAS